MGLVIAIAITLVVAGSILWVKPSPRDNAITEMRSEALACGLKVRLLDQKLAAALFPWVDNYRLYTLYELQLPVHAKPSSPKALVIRLFYPDDVHELDRDEELLNRLQSRGVLSSVPEKSEAIVVSPGGIALLWQEDIKKGKQVVAEVRQLLDSCISCSDLWK